MRGLHVRRSVGSRAVVYAARARHSARQHSVSACRLASLRGTRLFVKRNYLMALGGGNELRKLEFLLGEAQRQGADTITISYAAG